MDLTEYRKEFPILQKKIYLNTCSLGALSLRSRRYVQTFLDQWDEYGASAWYSIWLNECASVRSLLAQLLNADESEIALGHSISTLLGSIASCFSFEDRNEVIVTELDFPTANYQWLAKWFNGASITVLHSDNRISIPLERYASAISEKTAAVSTSSVFFTSGAIQDIAAINDAARKKGAVCIIDAYQSVGQIPIDIRTMNIDILLSGGLKWLLGGPGITFACVRKDLITTLKPTMVGWFGAKNQFAFNAEYFEPAEEARRFETGTPSVASVAAFKGGLEIILEIGVENIRTAASALIEELIILLQKYGFELLITDNPDERAAIVMIKHPNPAAAVSELQKRNIIVDYRKEYIRVSPYFYNTSEEIETFVETLQEVT